MNDIVYSTNGANYHTPLVGVYRWGFLSNDKPNGFYRVQCGVMSAELVRMMSDDTCVALHRQCVVDCFGNLVPVNHN